MPSSRHRYRQRERHPPPLFWDNLTKLYLTKGALRESNRRNQHKFRSPRQRALAISYISAPVFLRDCSAACLQGVRQLSRRGGPDLSDIRGHLPPPHFYQYSLYPTKYDSQPSTPPATTPSSSSSSSSSSTAVYDVHFQDHLVRHGIYPPPSPSASSDPDGTAAATATPARRPANWAELQHRLHIPLPADSSLDQAYTRFRRLSAAAYPKHLPLQHLLSILEGTPQPRALASSGGGSGRVFTNLAPLTDGTLPPARPDFYHASPGGFATAAAGGGDGDGRAYTFAVTYRAGQLRVYCVHVQSRPGQGAQQSDYVVTLVGEWALDGQAAGGDARSCFRAGVAAYRNARELAREYREGILGLANERYARLVEAEFPIM
ncbi:hypothetical protein P175DRAFT_0347841 [Aspergillus ochraceoroseus IBT 24754]|uniref:Uncharacterized protein n=1 Tax=Aspergillus ochraceoroseus IBT 24754 TaxID=1392256 RepID=A0A2T5LP61_9EURO|nr:uncharacterized protein P175DRAFT_0347841 [Aspergillus ochraceoroseus IBT 24754]PTU18073.1 hypothetical protein P175DRAFT_0347841 [Aspergillus ochraceoroseus IBT 24754]